MNIKKLLFLILLIFTSYNTLYSETWRFIQPFVDRDYGYNEMIFDIDAINDSTYLACTSFELIGRNSRINRTTDYGQSWNIVYRDEEIGLSGYSPNIEIISENILLFNARPTIQAKSYDTGLSWDKQILYNGTDTVCTQTFTDNKHGVKYIHSENDYFCIDYYYTTDFGNSWIKINVPDEFKCKAMAIFLYDINFAIGFIRAKGMGPLFLNITDSLSNWEVYQAPYDMRNFYLLDSLNCWSVGVGLDSAKRYRQRVYYSNDRCNTWKTLRDTFDNNTQLQYIRFADKKNGIVSGYPYALLRTTDGGETWIKDAIEGYPAELQGKVDFAFQIYSYPQESVAIGVKHGAENIDTAYVLNTNYANVKRKKGQLSSILHPNPATSQITLSLGDGFISKPEIDIIDYLGNAFKPEYDINGSEITINTSSLSPGVYFLRIRSGEKVEVRKFVVI